MKSMFNATKIKKGDAIMFQKILRWLCSLGQRIPGAKTTVEPEESDIAQALRENTMELLSSGFEEWFRKLSMEERLDCLFRVLEDAPTDEVDWNRINALLNANIRPFDYNAFCPVHSYHDVILENYRFIDALYNLAPWRKTVCRDCGKIIEMRRSEVQYYQMRELHLPTHCNACRTRRKQQKGMPSKTAMQLAFEKAGI